MTSAIKVPLPLGPIAMLAISAVIIARNEERDIGRTIAALPFVDEVLVVDSGSCDRTVEISRSLGARTLQHPFEGYGPQKAWAVGRAAHDWVLCLDADEVVTPELAAAIEKVQARERPSCAAYRFRFVTVFMGRPLLHGPVSRRFHVRLFDRRLAGWTNAAVHEQVVARGPVGELPGQVLHYTVHDLSESLGKLDAYSTLGAIELVRRGRRRGGVALALTAPVQFFRHYVLHQNFRNGVPGLVWSLMNAMGSVLKHVKARELEATPKIEAAPEARLDRAAS
jgi:glycosyltransferase involved in cell wall biosynthesis